MDGGGNSWSYVTDRNGEPEIWLREQENGDRSLVTFRNFPPGTTGYLIGPGGFSRRYARDVRASGKRRSRGLDRRALVDVVADRRSAGAAPRPGASEERVRGIVVA